MTCEASVSFPFPHAAGKFLNGYGEGARPSRPPAGWTVFDALTGASTYHFMEPCFRLNGGPKNCYDKSQGMHQVGWCAPLCWLLRCKAGLIVEVLSWPGCSAPGEYVAWFAHAAV